MKEIHHEAKREEIKGYVINIVSVDVLVAHDLKAEVLRVDTIFISRLCTRVSLVGQFKMHFRLPMEVILVSVTILVKVVFYL